MSGKRRNPQPLDAAKLEELALAYAARFATTRARLEGYLDRKLRERGWGGENAPRPDLLAQRMVNAGYVDDEAWARMKAGSLLRRGYGERRMGQTLGAAGIEPELRENMRPDEVEARRAAVALARRRRFGPFAANGVPDREVREKQLAAMMRAGHSLGLARAVLDLPDADAAERWAAEPDGDFD
jgi:regulatory protein